LAKTLPLNEIINIATLDDNYCIMMIRVQLSAQFGKPNTLKFLGRKKTKGPKQNSYNIKNINSKDTEL